MTPSSSGNDVLAVQRAYELAAWLLPKVEKFKRESKFTLGERLISASLDLLEALASAAYESNKTALLAHASRRLNALRMLVRLSKDLRLLGVDQYGFAAEHIDEIGRMIGGWRKSERA